MAQQRRRALPITKDRKVYLDLVVSCLQEFYGKPYEEAHADVIDLWKRTSRKLNKDYVDLFFHTEPIDVAADMMRDTQAISDSDFKRYREMILQVQPMNTGRLQPQLASRGQEHRARKIG